jgi:hypothetical protein
VTEENPFMIGDIDYGDPANLRALREELIDTRNRVLESDEFNPKFAVLLSHTIGVIGAFTDEKHGKEEKRDVPA